MPFSPLFMKDVLFEVAAIDYAAELSSVLFEADSSQETWAGLKPSSRFSQSTPPTYTCTCEYAQDWDSDQSFARFLYTHDGEELAATFKPKAGGLPGFTANIQVVSGPIGGKVDTYAESSVTMGSDKPVLVPDTTPPPLDE